MTWPPTPSRLSHFAPGWNAVAWTSMSSPSWGGAEVSSGGQQLTDDAGRVPLRRRSLRHRRLERREIPPVPLRLEAVHRNEAQRRRVHAVAQAGGRGPVVEHVSEMRIGVGRADFGTHREERAIDPLVDVARFEGFREARPPGAGVELVERAEERLAGHDVHLNPRPGVVPVLAAERRRPALSLRRTRLPPRRPVPPHAI